MSLKDKFLLQTQLSTVDIEINYVEALTIVFVILYLYHYINNHS